MSVAGSGSRLSRPDRWERPDDTPPDLTLLSVVGMCALILAVMLAAVWVANAGASALDQIGGLR